MLPATVGPMGLPGSVRSAGRDKRPLAAGVQVVKGELAVCLNGFYRTASGDENEIIVGRFYETVDNTGGAAGAQVADVHFIRERWLFLRKNDGTVTPAMRETPCSALDGQTFTAYQADSATNTIVYDVTDEGVWAEIK